MLLRSFWLFLAPSTHSLAVGLCSCLQKILPPTMMVEMRLQNLRDLTEYLGLIKVIVMEEISMDTRPGCCLHEAPSTDCYL